MILLAVKRLRVTMRTKRVRSSVVDSLIEIAGFADLLFPRHVHHHGTEDAAEIQVIELMVDPHHDGVLLPWFEELTDRCGERPPGLADLLGLHDLLFAGLASGDLFFDDESDGLPVHP